MNKSEGPVQHEQKYGDVGWARLILQVLKSLARLQETFPIAKCITWDELQVWRNPNYWRALFKNRITRIECVSAKIPELCDTRVLETLWHQNPESFSILWLCHIVPCQNHLIMQAGFSSRIGIILAGREKVKRQKETLPFLKTFPLRTVAGNCTQKSTDSHEFHWDTRETKKMWSSFQAVMCLEWQEHERKWRFSFC